MKRKITLKWILSLLCISMLLFAAACIEKKGSAGGELNLQDFQSDGQFCYKKIDWGLSPDEVEEKIGSTLKEQEGREGAPAEYAFYTTESSYTLGGQAASVSLEFQNGGLSILKFDFHLNSEYEEWFEEQAEKLTELYGELSDKFESSSSLRGGLTSKGYKWETDDTMMQLIVISGDSIHPSATLGVSAK